MKITITDDGTAINTENIKGNYGIGGMGFSNPGPNNNNNMNNPDLIRYLEYIEQVKRQELERYLNYIKYINELKQQQEVQRTYQQPTEQPIVSYPSSPINEEQSVVQPETSKNEGLAYSIGKTIPRLIDMGKEAIGNAKRGFNDYRNNRTNINDIYRERV